MFELSVKKSFSAAHRLAGYKGACANMHGHNYCVEIFVSAKKLNAIGIAIDLKLLKEYLAGVLAPLDHADLNGLPPFKRKNPSSENLAAHIFREMQKCLKGKPVTLLRVIVRESEDSYVTYIP